MDRTPAAAVERELLVSILDLTRGEAASRGDLLESMRITGEALGFLLKKLIREGLLSERCGVIEAAPGQRLEMAVRAVRLGADFERVCRALGWLEFEEMVAHVFEENGYEVRRRFRFAAEGRRWEVDVVASRRPHIFCAECKRWSRGMGNGAALRMVEIHLEKARVFGENLAKVAMRLGLGGWRHAVVVPVAMSLTPPP
ncbi:MAG: restriction endonuclease [Candidatus Bathyarchaeia archaeon]